MQIILLTAKVFCLHPPLHKNAIKPHTFDVTWCQCRTSFWKSWPYKEFFRNAVFCDLKHCLCGLTGLIFYLHHDINRLVKIREILQLSDVFYCLCYVRNNNNRKNYLGYRCISSNHKPTIHNCCVLHGRKWSFKHCLHLILLTFSKVDLWYQC